MTRSYGTRTNANIEKVLEVTAAKFKILCTIDIWMNGSTHELYCSVWDDTDTIIPMNNVEGNSYSGPFGVFLGFTGGNGHKAFTLERTSGVPYTVTELLKIRFNTTPWATDNPMYFYEIKLELVD